MERLAWLRELSPERIEFPASKLLSFKSGREGGLLFDQTLFSPLELARQEEVNLLIWGRFEEIQDYLYVEVRALDAVLAAEVYRFSDAGTPERLYEILDVLASELAAVLWGRDWSSLTVDSVPSGGYVWIDGSYRGRAPIELPYLVPGSKEVRVEAPGYQPLVRTIELAPYERGYEQIVLVRARRDLSSGQRSKRRASLRRVPVAGDHPTGAAETRRVDPPGAAQRGVPGIPFVCGYGGARGGERFVDPG